MRLIWALVQCIATKTPFTWVKKVSWKCRLLWLSVVIKSRDASIYFYVLRHVFTTLNDSGHPSALGESIFVLIGILNGVLRRRSERPQGEPQE